MERPPKRFSLVLHSPEIPGNTGSIGRTCLALQARLILIKPLAFEIDEKAVRRAGLDYWKYVDLTVYESWHEFLFQERADRQKIYLFENQGTHIWTEAPYSEDCYLVFGNETKGLPSEIVEEHKMHCYCLPQYSEHIRSLNLSNAATAVAYECLRQQML
jgi:tRNA (cytidine/uridine-2'-O-)-methyltransferase